MKYFTMVGSQVPQYLERLHLGARIGGIDYNLCQHEYAHGVTV